MERAAREVEICVVEAAELRAHAPVLSVPAAMQAGRKITKDEVINQMKKMKVRRYYNSINTPALSKTIESIRKIGGSISTLTVTYEITTVNTRSKKSMGLKTSK